MKRYLFHISLLIILLSLTLYLNSLYGLLIVLFLYFICVKQKVGKRTLLLYATVLIVFGIRMVIDENLNRTSLTGTETNFYMEVVDELRIDGNKLSFIGKESKNKEKVLVSYYISTKDEKIQLNEILKFGDKLTINGDLKKINSATNPNSFDYSAYMKNKNIYWQLTINKLIKIEKGKETTLQRIKNYRLSIIDNLVQGVPEELQGIFIALIVGERAYIDEQLSESYEKLGVVHLLAISGLHVTLLFGMIQYVLIRIGMVREHASIFLIIFIPIYAVLTGFTPSVVRACAMFLVFLLFALLKKKMDGVTCLSIVFIVYIFIYPKVILQLGFQLSFINTIAIILSANLVKRYSSSVITMLFITTICQLFSLPLQLFHFYEFSLLSLLANLLLIPLFSWVYLPLFTFLTICHLLNFSMAAVYEVIVPAVEIINIMTNKISEIKMATITTGTFPSIILIILYLIKIFLFIQMERQKKYRFYIYLLVVFYFSISFFNKYGPIGEVTMLDVGQGDCMYIDLPYFSGTYLIDTGGTISFPQEEWQQRENKFEVGADVVVPFLKSKGKTTVDKLILTHFDYDHVAGTFAILDEIKVKELVVPKYHPASEVMDRIIHKATSLNIKITYAERGDYWGANKNRFVVLNPVNKLSDSNNSSLVIYANMGGKSWLLTGDAEEEVELSLVRTMNERTIHVLKVGHHGSSSSTSSDLLSHFIFEKAWISVGGNNRYGHPTKEVMNALKVHEIDCFLTSENGAISYFFLGNRGTFSTQKP